MKARLRALSVNLALALASVLFAVGAGEVIVRSFRPQPLEAAYWWEDGTLRHRPSFEYTYTRREFSNSVRFNSLGLRGPEIPPEKRPGVPRVLVLGDSFVEGKQVGEEEVLTAVLERMARERGRELEVINAGMAGVGTAEEIFLWDRVAGKLDPEVVILGFYPNDVRNNVKRRFFVLEDGKIVSHREPYRPKVRWIYDVRKVLAAHSHFYVLLRDGKNILREWLEESLQEAVTDEVPPWRARLLETEDVFEIEPSPVIKQGWELTEALLTEIKRRVEARGARFVLAVFPTRYQVDRELWLRHARKVGLDPSRYDLDYPSRRLRQWALRQDVLMVDLLQPFRDRNLDNTFYFSLDAHWNRHGHELAASVIHDALAGVHDEGLQGQARF